MKGFFDLKTAGDLLAKLERDYTRLCDHPNDTDAAYNFFVTAWHLLEWQYPGRAEKTRRDDVRDRHPVLQIAEHLAVGAKHFEPKDTRLQSVSASAKHRVWAEGSWKPGSWSKHAWKATLSVELDGNARDTFGEQITVSDLAEKLMTYWRGECGLIAPR